MSPHLTAPRSAQAHVNPPQALDRAPEAVRDRRGPPHDCRGVLLVPTTMRRLLPNLVRNERRAIEREGQAHTRTTIPDVRRAIDLTKTAPGSRTCSAPTKTR